VNLRSSKGRYNIFEVLVIKPVLEPIIQAREQRFTARKGTKYMKLWHRAAKMQSLFSLTQEFVSFS